MKTTFGDTLKEHYLSEREDGEEYDDIKDGVKGARIFFRQLACHLVGLEGDTPADWRSTLEKLESDDENKSKVDEALGAARLTVLLGAVLEEKGCHTEIAQQLIGDGESSWNERASPSYRGVP